VIPSFAMRSKASGPVTWDRRLVAIGVALIAAGFVAVFVPIGLLANELASAFSAAGAAKAMPPPNILFAAYAIPIGAFLGLVCVVAGMALVARARRRGPS